MSRWADAYRASIGEVGTGKGVNSSDSVDTAHAQLANLQSSSVSSVRRVTDNDSLHKTTANLVSPVSAVSCNSNMNYLPAAPKCPPAWSEESARPRSGYFCGCCGSRRWWSDTQGWRCWTCHPCSHLPADAVIELRT
jgi:hypothetical protein